MEKTKVPGCSNCTHCGFCCRDLDIDLSKGDIRRINYLGYPLNHFLIAKPSPRLRLIGKRKNCVFLDEKNLCKLHKKHGHFSKPYACRIYPDNKPKEVYEGEKDYLFYQYSGKIFPKDVLLNILEELKDSDWNHFFRDFLVELKFLEKQEEEYVDVFNMDLAKEKKLGNLARGLSTRRIDKWFEKTVKPSDLEAFKKISKRHKRKVHFENFIETIQNLVKRNTFINPNFPEMLLRFFYMSQFIEKRIDLKQLEEFMVTFNRRYM